MLEPCTQALSEEPLRHEYTIQLPPGNRVYQVPVCLCEEERGGGCLQTATIWDFYSLCEREAVVGNDIRREFDEVLG